MLPNIKFPDQKASHLIKSRKSKMLTWIREFEGVFVFFPFIMSIFVLFIPDLFLVFFWIRFNKELHVRIFVESVGSWLNLFREREFFYIPLEPRDKPLFSSDICIHFKFSSRARIIFIRTTRLFQAISPFSALNLVIGLPISFS